MVRSSSLASMASFSTATIEGNIAWNALTDAWSSSESITMAILESASIVLILTSKLSGSWIVLLNNEKRSLNFWLNPSPMISRILKRRYTPTARSSFRELVAACWRKPGNSGHSPSSRSTFAMAPTSLEDPCRTKVLVSEVAACRSCVLACCRCLAGILDHCLDTRGRAWLAASCFKPASS